MPVRYVDSASEGWPVAEGVLPDGTDASAIRAESKDGILTVHVPKTKTETKKPTTIKVR